MTSKMIVRGVARSDGTKDYKVTYEGKEYIATRKGSKFQCGIHTGSLAYIKQLILNQLILTDSDSEQDDSPAETDNDSELSSCSTWYCMHPCAILTLTIGDVYNVDRQRDIMLTLDAFGWLTDDGKPDYRRAMKEQKVFRDTRKPQVNQGGES